MRYWCSTVFGFRYWFIFLVICGVISCYLITFLISLVYALCEQIGYLVLG
jgi:hypothetical protein